MKELKPETQSPKLETEFPETLIGHRSSEVLLEKEHLLFFATSDKKGALVFFLTGVLCFYISIALLVWRLSSGEFHPPSITSGMVVFVVGVFFQWLGVRRYKPTGAYYIDAAKRIVYSKDLRFQASLDEIKRVFFVFDPLEMYQFNMFPEFPMWLTIEFKDGKRIRVGKGRRVELVPVLNWLVAARLPYSH